MGLHLAVMAFLTLALCVSLLMVPTAAAANTNGRAWKGDAHAGDQCIPEWQNQTITGLPVHFSCYKLFSVQQQSHEVPIFRCGPCSSSGRRGRLGDKSLLGGRRLGRRGDQPQYQDVWQPIATT